MAQRSVRYNVRWGSKSKSDASSLLKEKCVKYRKKLDAARQKMKGLAQKNKKLVQALEAAKAKIIELEEAASRQLKIDSLYLPRLKSWLEAEESSMSALLKNFTRSTKLLQDILTPDADLTLTGDSSLQEEAATPKPRPSLHPPGIRYCDEDRMSMVLEEDEMDKTEVMEPLHNSTEPPLEEVTPEVTHPSRVTVRTKSRHSGRRCSLPDELRAVLGEPLDVPAFAVLDERASSLVAEVIGQEKCVVRAETVVMPPPEKLKGHSADEYSAAFSHRPKIPRTPCRTDGDDGGTRPAPTSDDPCSSPKQRRRMQPRRVSEIPLPPWPRKPDSTSQGSLKECVVKEFGAEVTNTLLLSPVPSFLDEAFVESPSPTELPTEKTPSPERVGDCWGDENSPPLAKIRRRQSANKSRAANGTKPKASRVTFVVKKRRGSEVHEDGAVGLMNGAPSLPDPSVDGQCEEGCGDRPLGVGGTPQRQHPPAVDVVDPSAAQHRSSLPKKQRSTTEKRSKPHGKKSEGKKKKTADIEEEPAAQIAAPVPYPAEKQPEGGKSSGKKLQVKKTITGTEELAPQLAAPIPYPAEKQPEGGKSSGKKLQVKTSDTEKFAFQLAAPALQLADPAPNATEKQLPGSESRGKKSRGKRIADCEEGQALQPAVPACLPVTPPRAQQNGCTPPLPEPLDAVLTSSADNDSSSQCTRSGRPARTATKCATYKLPSLSTKMRRP